MTDSSKQTLNAAATSLETPKTAATSLETPKTAATSLETPKTAATSTKTKKRISNGDRAKLLDNIQIIEEHGPSKVKVCNRNLYVEHMKLSEKDALRQLTAQLRLNGTSFIVASYDTLLRPETDAYTTAEEVQQLKQVRKDKRPRPARYARRMSIFVDDRVEQLRKQAKGELTPQGKLARLTNRKHQNSLQDGFSFPDNGF